MNAWKERKFLRDRFNEITVNPQCFRSGKQNGIVKVILCPVIRVFNLIDSQTWWINLRINHFALSWINSKVNSNHEIITQNKRGNFFLPHWNLNHGLLEPRASVLPMSYTDSLVMKMFIVIPLVLGVPLKKRHDKIIGYW